MDADPVALYELFFYISAVHSSTRIIVQPSPPFPDPSIQHQPRNREAGELLDRRLWTVMNSPSNQMGDMQIGGGDDMLIDGYDVVDEKQDVAEITPEGSTDEPTEPTEPMADDCTSDHQARGTSAD